MDKLTSTPAAVTALGELAANHGPGSMRISLLTGGCGIRFFGISLDGTRSGDTTVEHQGFSFVIESTLLEEYAPITIDSDGLTFRLAGGNIYPPSACGSCAFGCGPRGKLRCDGICRRCPNPCLIGKKKLARRSGATVAAPASPLV